jgi:hypothetical protein
VLEHFEAPPFSLLVGAPAKVKRTYDDQDACRARAAKQAQQYAARAQAYRRSLCECIYGVAAVASFLAAAVTEIYLSNVCSCQEILRGNGRGQTTEIYLSNVCSCHEILRGNGRGRCG